ncbi:MAG: alpha/beta fold hydrolase [Myxococcales bacterium]
MFTLAQGHLTAYQDVGSGPTLVLLHGLGATGESFTPVVDALSPRYRLIVPDLLGNGRSAKPDIDYTPAALAEHVLELLEAVGAGPVRAVIGHSLGACVAVELAASLGPSVALCLVDPPPPRGSWIAGLVASLAGKARLADFTSSLLPTRAIAKLWLGFLFADPSKLDERTIDRYAEAASGRGYAAATLSSIRNLGKLDLPVSERRPALLVWGAEDPIFPPSGASAWLPLLPRAQVTVLPACGHCPLEEAPGALTAALSLFLRGLEEPSREIAPGRTA